MNTSTTKQGPPAVNPTVVIVILIVIVLSLFLMNRPRPKVINLSNLSRQDLKQKPAPQVATPAAVSSPNDGIVSFEMYPNPKKTQAAISEGTSREALIRFVMEGVSGIEDDLTAKNALISQISKLNFKITGTELLSILQQASIGDGFYYTSAIKSVATSLQYPLTDEEFKRIINGVADEGYQFKLRTVLDREQARNAVP